MDIVVDMHIHSTASDGSDSPRDLVEKVKEAGIRCFALTDHDTDKGCDEAERITAEDPELFFVRGIEISCEGDDDRKYHILGYAFPREAKLIEELIAQSHAIRMAKLEGRLHFLSARFGFSFSEEEREYLYSLQNPGKPHIGLLMARKGLAKSKEDAIESFLNLYYGEEGRIRPERAVEAISLSGGVPVLAHSIYGDGAQKLSYEAVEKRIVMLREYGLMGVECFYWNYTRTDERTLLALAEKNGLMASAGSDCHGMHKTGIFLGQHGLTREKMELAPVRAFLDRVTQGRFR